MSRFLSVEDLSKTGAVWTDSVGVLGELVKILLRVCVDNHPLLLKASTTIKAILTTTAFVKAMKSWIR